MPNVFRGKSPLWASLALCVASAFAGCSPRPEGETAQPAQRSESSYTEAGSYQMHYNAFRSDTLKPEVARAYGIERSKNRVTLNVTVLRKEGTAQPTPVEAEVSVEAYNLNGQQKQMSIRRVNEGAAIYYIGETGINGAEILAFNIKATPLNDTTLLEGKMRREFFSD